MFVVVAERQEDDAVIFEAGSQILVTAAYLYIVMTWKPFVSAPARYNVCGKRFSFDVYNDFEQFGVYTQLAVQVFALHGGPFHSTAPPLVTSQVHVPPPL